MALNDTDVLSIIRLQILLEKIRRFKNKNEAWFYLGYIQNFVDEMDLRSKRQSESKVGN